jgi:hypothetical protein
LKFGSPGFDWKIKKRQAFGPQAESTLKSAVNRENAFANTTTAITGNSMTAKREAMGDASKEATASKPLIDGRLSDTRLHGILMEGAKNAINRVVLSKVTSMRRRRFSALAYRREAARA